MLTPQQTTFFATFGYLALPGLLRDDVAWIQDEFEAVWAARPDVVHDGSRRTMFPGSFIDQRERLCGLLDHPRIDALITDLLGAGWGYYGGDGNFYSGDTGWHCDAIPPGYEGVEAKRVVRHLKVAFYLDAVGRDSGALRVIPGSHRWREGRHAAFRESLYDCQGRLGIRGQDVPAAALEIVPGDIVCFDHLTWHAAYGGGPRRRMFTINTTEACARDEQRRANETVFGFYGDEGCTSFWGETMVRTATPKRRERMDALKPFLAPMAERAARREAAAKS